jgi:hypothetical protein
MDNIIYFLILVIVLIILGHFLVKNKEPFAFGFSPNDRYYQHELDKKQRTAYDLFVEDENLVLKEPRLNNVLRDVRELMNHKSTEGNIYEMTRVKKKDYTNNMGFW